jgi:hypothetical protein
VILAIPLILAIRLVRIFGISWFIPRVTVVTPGLGTKGWDGLDDRAHRIYPSSPTAWSYQNLPDGSREQDGQAQQDVQDSTFGSWTDGDALAHEHQASGSNSLGPGHRKRDPAEGTPRDGKYGRPSWPVS